MAVNDLMMRIQLLVDSGKSSAELGRVQASLNALTKDLAKLSQIKLNLKDQLAGLTELGSKLKQVNLGNFTTSISELEKGFGKLNLQTTQLAKLRDAFQNIEVAKLAQATSSYAKDLEKVNQQLKDAKQYNLTNGRQSFNTSLSLQNQLLVVNASKVKDVNNEIVIQRKEIARLNEQIKNSATLYADQRKAQGLTSLSTLTRGLELDTANAKLWNDRLSGAKSNLAGAKDNLKAIKQEASQLTKQKILDFGITDSDKNAVAIRSTIAEMQRLNSEIEKQKRNLDISKRIGSPNRYAIDQGLVQNEAALRTINKLVDDQTIKTKQLTTSKLLAAQATEQELNKITLINNQLRMDAYTKGNATSYVSKLKAELVDLNNQAIKLKATDFSSFAQPIIDATSNVNRAKVAYQQLKVETQRAVAAVKTASLVDPTTYKSAIDLLDTYRNTTIQSTKVLADHKSELRSVKDELKLVNQDYRDFSRLLREARQDARQLKLPSQAAALAEYQQLNSELDTLKNKRELFKSLQVDPQIEKVRQLRNAIKEIGTEQSSVDIFKNANRSILLIKEQLNNLKFGGIKGTLDFAPLITQFGALKSGGLSIEAISQKMRDLRLQIKQTTPDLKALSEVLVADKTQVLIGKDAVSDAQKALTDLKIAAKAAKDNVLTELAPIATQLKTLGETRISKANLTEGLLNQVSKLKKELNDIQPAGLESIRKETDKLNASLTALRFGNAKGIIPIDQIQSGNKSIAALKQEIESLRVSAKSIKLSDSFFAGAPSIVDSFKKAGLSNLNDALNTSIGSWKDYSDAVQSWTSRLRESQAAVVNTKNSINQLKNVGDQSIRALSASIRDTRLEMQRVGTVNFNQAFRDEGVVNLLDRMNAVKKSMLDISKISAGQQQPILSEGDKKNLLGINQTFEALKKLNEAYSGLEGAYKKGTPSATLFSDAIKSVKELNSELGNTFKVNLNEASFKQRFKDALSSLSNQASAILVPIKFSGLTEIQNEIRRLAADKGLEKALNVDTVSANAKAVKTEIDVLKELKRSLNEVVDKKNDQKIIDAHTERVRVLNEQLVASGKVNKAYTTSLDIETKLIELEGTNVSLKLKSADAAKKITDNQSLAIAKLKEQEAIGKNNLNNLSQEAKEINQILAAERNRAKLAKEAQRTTLLNLTGDLNTTKSSIGNRTKEIADQQVLNGAYRLGLTLLSDLGKTVKSNANLAYGEAQKTIASKLQELGLLKSTESSYLRQLAAQRDAEKAAKSAAQTAKDVARLNLNAAQLESETNQNALRGSRERASALRDISSAIRANATVAGLSNAESIRSGESLIAQLKRQYQQYDANVAATQSEIASKKEASKAGLAGLYEELAGLQRQRVALLDVAGILKRRNADQELIKKTESARLAGLKEEQRIQLQIATIEQSDRKSTLGTMTSQLKSAKTAVDALVLAGKDLANNLVLGDVGGTDTLNQRVSLTQRLRDLTKQTLGFENQLNQSRSVRDTQASVVKDLEAQVKATKALAVANLEVAKNRELNAQASVVTAKSVLSTAQQELAQAKSINETKLAGLTVQIAERNVGIATAKQNISVMEKQIAEREKAITLIREEQAARVAAVAKQIESLDIQKAQTAEQKALLTAQKNDLTNQLDQENAKRKQAIGFIQQQIDAYKAQQVAANNSLTALITNSKQANLESQRAAQVDIVGREQSIKGLEQAIALNAKKILSDKEAIKQYATGLKEYEKGIRASITEANQRIASGQLSKTQLAEERAGIKELIKEQQNLSKAYIGRLTEQAGNLQSSLKGERDRIKLLEEQAKAETDVIQKQVLMTAALKAKNELSKVGGQEQSLTRQIQETGDLAKAELQRLAIVERLGNAAQKQNFGAAIKETQRIIDETTKRLSDLSVKSDAAKVKLGAIGSTADLATVNTQIKQAISDLKSLKQAGGSGTITYANMESQLAGLREQRALLRQIAQIDIKTASGQVELKGLQQTINQLREAQREMSKLNQFAQGFKQGFTFALQPDQLGMAAFNTLQQVLSELGRKFIEVNAQSETLIRGLSAVFGVGQGEVQFEKLIGLANTYGLSLHDLSRNYLSLNASSKGTILEGQESEKIFRSLSAAMAVLGADTISTQRAFRAVSQMISKGQVYVEELKGQLAESLPGAIQIFARSMGKTSQEFLAMVKAGQVGLNELIPFFQQLEKEYGAAATASTTYEQATNRLGNAFTILLKNLGDTGIWKAIVSVINEAGDSVNIVAKNMGIIATNVDSIFAKLKMAALPGLSQFKSDLIKQDVIVNTKESESSIDKLLNKVRIFDAFLKSPSSFIFPVVTAGASVALDKFTQKTVSDLSKIQALSEDAFNALKKSPESSDIALPNTYSEYISYVTEFNQKVEEENQLRAKFRADNQQHVAAIHEETKAYKESLAAFKARMEARGGYTIKDNSDTNAISLTKRQIREEQNLLNIRQQSYLSLSSIQQSMLQQNLKAKSVSDSLITESQSVDKLIGGYAQLAEAKRLEGQIVEGTTPADQAASLRQLTIDQLKHAQTVARGANNLGLQLQIMTELNRVQQDVLNKTTANTSATNVSGVASDKVLKTVKEMTVSLQATTTKGYEYANSIFKGLSYTQQMNQLLAQQKVLMANRQQDQYSSERSMKDDVKRAEEVAKAIKASQESTGEYFTPEKKSADLEYMKRRKDFALAEEQWAKAKKTTNNEEKQALTELALKNAENAREAAVASGDSYNVKNIKEFVDGIKLAKTNVEDLNIAAQQKTLNDYFKFDANNKFDIGASFKQFGDAFNELLAKRQEALTKLGDPTQKLNNKDKAEYQKVVDDANAKLAALNTVYGQLEQAAKASGQQVPVNLKPVVPQEVLDAERAKMAAPVTTSIVLDTETALSQNAALVKELTKAAYKNVYIRTFDTGSSSSSGDGEKKRWGGFISGYGGGDKIRALLEPGEFVLRKEAVQALGLDRISRLNRLGQNLRVPNVRSVDQIWIPKFANGGLVGGSPIVINVPGQRAIQVSGSRESAMALANLLTRTSRAL